MSCLQFRICSLLDVAVHNMQVSMKYFSAVSSVHITFKLLHNVAEF